MRDIEFRGRRKDNNYWIYGCLFKDLHGIYINGKPILCSNMNQDFIEVLPETVGQYTGHQDIHNDDIYENDRVKNSVYEGIVKYGRALSGDGLAYSGFYIECGKSREPLDGSLEIIES